MKTHSLILLTLLLASNVRACIWDADSLWHEKFRSHDLAKAITGQATAPENPERLKARIKELEANRKENEADWWNNLAGAYLRLNQPEVAVKLLEPVVKKFQNDYGIHANLGTAYHLLGKYAEAEKEIARDLQINPDAHFGLEKYHLALLQYLVRSSKYQMRHVYVDEFTGSFLNRDYRFHYEKFDESGSPADSKSLAEAEADMESLLTDFDGSTREMMLGIKLKDVAALDSPPPYRTNWNLATGAHFEAGVVYMGQMNPKEPACFTMLGIAALEKRDYHLAQSAFEKAIALNSPQKELLQIHVGDLNKYISQSPEVSIPRTALLAVLVLVLAYSVYSNFRRRRKAIEAA